MEILSCSKLLACQVWLKCVKELSSSSSSWLYWCCQEANTLHIHISFSSFRTVDLKIVMVVQWRIQLCWWPAPNPELSTQFQGRTDARQVMIYGTDCCQKLLNCMLGLSKIEWCCEINWHLAYFVNCRCTVGLHMARYYCIVLTISWNVKFIKVLEGKVVVLACM